MISVIVSIFFMVVWVFNCINAIRNDYHIITIAFYSACTGYQYHFMCLRISEYLFKQI
jgi:hypothetical protein